MPKCTIYHSNIWYIPNISKYLRDICGFHEIVHYTNIWNIPRLIVQYYLSTYINSTNIYGKFRLFQNISGKYLAFTILFITQIYRIFHILYYNITFRHTEYTTHIYGTFQLFLNISGTYSVFMTLLIMKIYGTFRVSYCNITMSNA